MSWHQMKFPATSPSHISTPHSGQHHGSPRRSRLPLSYSEMHRVASKARRKLSFEAGRDDLRLRVLVGHANLLDTLSAELWSCKRNSRREVSKDFPHPIDSYVDTFLEDDSDESSDSEEEDDEFYDEDNVVTDAEDGWNEAEEDFTTASNLDLTSCLIRSMSPLASAKDLEKQRLVTRPKADPELSGVSICGGNAQVDIDIDVRTKADISVKVKVQEVYGEDDEVSCVVGKMDDSMVALLLDTSDYRTW